MEGSKKKQEIKFKDCLVSYFWNFWKSIQNGLPKSTVSGNALRLRGIKTALISHNIVNDH